MSFDMGSDPSLEFLQKGLRYSIRKSVAKVANSLIRNFADYSWVTREELIRAAESNNHTVRLLGETEHAQFDAPARQLPPSEEIAEAIGSFEFDPAFVVEIENATIRGSLALSSLSSGEFIAEKDADRPDLLGRSLGYYVAERMVDNPLPKTQSFGVVTPLVGPMAKTYFHWFADYLSRLEWVIAYASKTGTYPTLLVPSDPPSWLSESLSLIDYPSEFIKEWKGGVAVADRLVIPSSRRRHCPWRCSGFEHFQPSAFRWLREELGNNAINLDYECPSIIFISREDADSRRVVNRSELLEFLNDFNISKVVLSELSLKEQIGLFRNADLVIAPHGAGLVNTAFTERIGVVELYGSHYNALFYSLTEGQGNPYASVCCEDIGNNLRVEPRQVELATETVLSEINS